MRLEQQYRDIPKAPCARTRQDSLILAFWGSCGTTDIRNRPFKRHPFSPTRFLSRQATEKPLLVHAMFLVGEANVFMFPSLEGLGVGRVFG